MEKDGLNGNGLMNNTVVITGASGGIGAAIADAFARLGSNVVAVYNKNPDGINSLCQKFSNAVGFKADISSSSEVNALFDFVSKNFGGADILVNSAGIAQQKLFTDITDEDFTRMFDVNVRGVFNCCRAALPFMIHKKHGRIINISSMWGVSGASCEVHYSASKAAVIGMTKALAKEVGPSGITVNCIAPGLIDTPMNSSLDESTLSQLCDETPVGRIGTPQDIANAVLFLSKDESSFVTGQVLSVDGGFV